jgi:hypothetical protein
MRLGAAIALLATAVACSGGGLFKQYEYEEDVYLSLDGSATVYVNSSVPALDALRGATFDPAPNARLDLNEVRAFFTTPVTRVKQVSETRRSNRRFVHVSVDVDDVGTLSSAAPFAWSSYHLVEQGGRLIYRQTVGHAAGKDVGKVNWTGRELVAFRLHLPSKVIDHSGENNYERGNILLWEQPLEERLASRPLVLAAEMETESILAHTLLLFGATCLSVVAVFGLVIWSIARQGTPKSARY